METKDWAKKVSPTDNIHGEIKKGNSAPLFLKNDLRLVWHLDINIRKKLRAGGLNKWSD